MADMTYDLVGAVFCGLAGLFAFIMSAAPDSLFRRWTPHPMVMRFAHLMMMAAMINRSNDLLRLAAGNPGVGHIAGPGLFGAFATFFYFSTMLFCVYIPNPRPWAKVKVDLGGSIYGPGAK